MQIYTYIQFMHVYASGYVGDGQTCFVCVAGVFLV